MPQPQQRPTKTAATDEDGSDRRRRQRPTKTAATDEDGNLAVDDRQRQQPAGQHAKQRQ
jgi:hypothetical protein